MEKRKLSTFSNLRIKIQRRKFITKKRFVFLIITRDKRNCLKLFKILKN